MLPVSATWKEAVKAQFRRQAYLKMSIEVTPPELREGAVVSSDNTNSNSSIDSIMDHLDTSPVGYFSLEPNRGVLNGTLRFLKKGSKTDDWWGNDFGGKASIHFQFDQAYSVPGIYAEWDLITHSYPSSITIIGYGNDGEEKHRYTNVAITSESGFIPAELSDVRSVDLVINGWSNPNWLPRVNEIMFGLYVNFDSINAGRITGATIKHTAKPLSDALPTYDVSITLRNLDKYFDPALKTGVAPYIARRQLAKYQWGFTTSHGVIEWTDKLPTYIKEFSIPEDSKDVEFNFTDRLALLDASFYKGTYTGSSRTLYDIAEYVLSNSDLITDSEGQTPWVIPESLKNFSTVAPVVKDDVPGILQYIALASCTWLTIDTLTGYVKFMEPKSGEADAQIGTGQELGDPSITVIDRVRSVKIAVYKYTKAEESKSLGDSEYTVSGTQEIIMQYTVDYAVDVQANVSGATLQSAQYFASYAIIKVTASLTGATVKVELTGYELVQSVSYLETFRDAAVSQGIDVTVENPFVTSTDKLNVLTDYVLKYYNRRTRYSAPYIGYPELEPVDKVDFNTVYSDDEADVVSNSIEYNGGWSGTLEVI